MADSTVAPSGGDFTTLAAALSDGGTGTGDTITIEGDWTSASDTSEATVEDDNITIVVSSTGGARHAGFYNGTTNHELNTNGNSHSLTIDNTGCTVDGLIVVQSGTGQSDEGIRFDNDGGTVTYLNVICRAANQSNDQDGFYSGDITVTVNMENCIAIGWGRAGYNAQNFGASGSDTHTWNLISCLAWNNNSTSETDGAGLNARARASGSTVNINAHNCLFIDNDGGDASADDWNVSTQTQSGTINWSLDNCVSADTSVTDRDAGAENPHTGYVIGESDTSDADGDVLVNDITTPPYNLTLIDDANNDAQDDHTNGTAANGLAFGDYVGSSVDIAGTTRPVNTNYDLGPYEVPAAADPIFETQVELLGVGM